MRRIALPIFFAALVASESAAAMDIFLRAKGPSNPTLSHAGDSTSLAFPGVEGWFAVRAFQFGTENTINIGSATSGGGAGKAQALPAGFAKLPNAASAALFNSCVLGAHWDEFEIVFARPSGGQSPGSVVLRVELKLVIVGSVGIAASSGDDAPGEDVQIQYGAQRITFYSQDSTGKVVQSGQSIWSFVQNNATFTAIL